MEPSRRDVLRTSALAGTSLALGGYLSLARALPAGAQPAQGYGPLVADPAGRLDLPEGFRYSVVAVAGEADGVTGLVKDRVEGGADYPGHADGTGSFPDGRGTILVQNHELGTTAVSPVPHDTGAPVYDPLAVGGTTNLVLDEHARVLRRYVSLAGTLSNCAGGTTPWGSWLTCEETESSPSGSTKKHGWVFEVDSLGQRTTGEPLTAMGRFAHEAVCIDPATNVAYLTEDASSPNGLLYRFLPADASGRYGSYAHGGALQAARCRDAAGNPIDDLAQVTRAGEALSVEWVAVPDALATSTSIRKQFPSTTGLGPSSFVTRSKKYEGCWWGKGTAWLNCSFNHPPADLPKQIQNQARPAVGHDGQVWRYNPHLGTLTLVAYFPLALDRATNPSVFDGPDNIVVAPWGGAFLCEDGDGDNHVISLDVHGTPSFFATNRIFFGGEFAEFTGACFSADSKHLFVNTQVPGVSYAISGPFSRHQHGGSS